MVKKSNIHTADDNSLELPADSGKDEELAQSYSVAKKLLPFLAKRGIPASPKNYRLFFDYILYTNLDLNRTINELLSNDAKFYSQLTSTVYDHFYSGETADSHTEAINKAASEFMALSSNMQESLQSAIDQTSHYQKVLTDTSQHMTAVTTSTELQPLLTELLNETEAALVNHDHFSTRISEANQLIVSLKTELENQTFLATKDELTKLYNRRHLNNEAPKIIAGAINAGLPVSLVAFDLDFFKRINDTWGHNYGDKVLTICAETIEKSANDTGMAVRMGGEEFLLLLPGLDLKAAAEVAEKVRNDIDAMEITVRGDTLPITISGGVAQYIKGENLTTVIGRADEALYKAKRSGRNLICLAE